MYRSVWQRRNRNEDIKLSSENNRISSLPSNPVSCVSVSHPASLSDCRIPPAIQNLRLRFNLVPGRHPDWARVRTRARRYPVTSIPAHQRRARSAGPPAPSEGLRSARLRPRLSGPPRGPVRCSAEAVDGGRPLAGPAGRVPGPRCSTSGQGGARGVWKHFRGSGPIWSEFIRAGRRRFRRLRAGTRSCGRPGPPVYDYRGQGAPSHRVGRIHPYVRSCSATGTDGNRMTGEPESVRDGCEAERTNLTS